MNLRKKFALSALSIAVMVAKVHADDPFIKGGCFPLEGYHKQQAALQMSGIAALEGNSVFLPVLEEDYRFALNMYKFGDKQRTLLTVRDVPEKRKPSKACTMFFSEDSRGVLGDINPDTPGVKPWIEGGDLQAIRTICANKALPKMIELDNQKVTEVGGTWMTWFEKMSAMAKILGEDPSAERRKWDKKDAERIAKSREQGDGYCDRFSEILNVQTKMHRKLAMLVSGKHLLGSKGALVSDGALALFVPAIKSKPDDPIGWKLYMVGNDGKAYLIGDGDKVVQ